MPHTKGPQASFSPSYKANFDKSIFGFEAICQIFLQAIFSEKRIPANVDFPHSINLGKSNFLIIFRISEKFVSPINMFRIVIKHFVFSLTQMILM